MMSCPGEDRVLKLGDHRVFESDDAWEQIATRSLFAR